LILQHGELGHGVVGDRDGRAGDIVAVVVHAVHVEAVIGLALPAHAGAGAIADAAALRDTRGQQAQIQNAGVIHVIAGGRQVQAQIALESCL